MGVCGSKFCGFVRSGAKRQDGGDRAARAPHGDDAFLHRSSQENSLLHLSRHHRVHPFHRDGDKFGLGANYEIERVLGRGGTGETHLARDRRAGGAGELVAIKLQQRPIPRESVEMSYNECLVQATVCEGCVNCTTIREVLLTPTHLGLVLELEAGGTLAEEVARRVPTVGPLDLVVPEEEARFLFKQLMAAVNYLHAHHTAHRDIKLDNTLLDARHPPTVKLADFQFAYYWGTSGAGFKSTQHLGTPVAMSPELIAARDRAPRHAFDPVLADVWAAAVWLVATLVGAFPFDNAPGADTLAAERQILEQELAISWRASRFVKPYLAHLTPECLDLLDRMLRPDPEQRISVAGVLRHPWMTKPLPPDLEAGWARVQEEQAAATARVQSLQLDAVLVARRNEALHRLVTDAAAPAAAGGAQHGAHHRHAAGPDAGLARVVDYSSIPGGVRIDMRLRAVALESPPLSRPACA